MATVVPAVLIEQAVPDMGTKARVGAADLPLAALNSQETPVVVDRMKVG